MIHWLTIKQIIPATPSNPSVPSSNPTFFTHQIANLMKPAIFQHGSPKGPPLIGTMERPLPSDTGGFQAGWSALLFECDETAFWMQIRRGMQQFEENID